MGNETASNVPRCGYCGGWHNYSEDACRDKVRSGAAAWMAGSRASEEMRVVHVPAQPDAATRQSRIDALAARIYAERVAGYDWPLTPEFEAKVIDGAWAASVAFESARDRFIAREKEEKPC